MIRSSTEVQRSRRGEAGGRFVAYVPYDPSAETPDEGGTDGHPPALGIAAFGATRHCARAQGCVAPYGGTGKWRPNHCDDRQLVPRCLMEFKRRVVHRSTCRLDLVPSVWLDC
jgi:hypothetical protein